MENRRAGITPKWAKVALPLLLLIAAAAAAGLFYGDKLLGTKPVSLIAGKFKGRPAHEHEPVPVKDEGGKIKYWTCTMHPSVRMPGPGKCPICAMDLVPVREEPAQAEVEEINRSTFTVSPERQQMIGVQTEPVSFHALEQVIRTVGRVELDETRIAYVHTKFSGWIDKVYANFTWQHVHKGDPLFSIYSPDLVSTQEEYLLALKSKEALSDSPFPHISRGANSLLEAARKRLLLWDITEEQIAELERTRQAKRTLIFYSPISGHITEKNAFENMRVEPGTRIYTIADHSRVWVHVDVYENEIPFVRLGQLATMTVPSYPGEVFRGKVSYIWPHLEHQTRTLKVRLEFPNPNLKLKPEMYANVELKVPLGRRLAIPSSAVLRTGAQDIVFVDRGQGRMEMRRVKLGAKAGDYYEVLRGLKPGEKIVSAANFLIDAESKVQGAEATWETPEPQREKR